MQIHGEVASPGATSNIKYQDDDHYDYGKGVHNHNLPGVTRRSHLHHYGVGEQLSASKGAVPFCANCQGC
jgi:hypothetical protein